MPVFFRLWVSLAETPMQNISTPQASPRSSPFSLSTRPESDRPRRSCPAVRRRNSASVSAICGTFSGCTNEPTWTMSTPAAIEPADPGDLLSVGTTCFSICSPSRGPTSWMTMRVMAPAAATASPRWLRAISSVVALPPMS